MESYAHHFAKLTVADWLLSGLRLGGERYYPWVELPIRSPCLPYWQSCTSDRDTSPTNDNVGFTRVLDIGLRKDDTLVGAVEIVHTNPCSFDKLEWAREHNITIIEVSARWVLNQVQCPNELVHQGIHINGEGMQGLL